MKRTVPLSRGGGLKRGAPKRKRGISPASPAQREKVAGLPCIVCGVEADGYTRVIDPAHVVSRALGGCDDALCVVPLCRWANARGGCHADFDSGRLDLAPYLEPRWREEAGHAVTHVGLYGALRRISGRNYEREDAA